MAHRSTSLRHNLLTRNNENSLRIGKEVLSKQVTGPTQRRAALGDIGNKGPVQRSISEVNKKKAAPFKKPVITANKLTKKPAQPTIDENSHVVLANNSTVCEESAMLSIAATPAPAETCHEDMSVVESSVVQEEEVAAVEEDPDIRDLSDAFSAKLLTVTDIDAEDRDNPQLVTEYVNQIYAYLRKLEMQHPVRRRYLEGHSVTSRMRCILVDWLVQVHMRFNLMQETLYLTIMILDRFLQLVPDTPKDELQLVGVTAMFVASKYEEMYCSEIGDYVYITDKAYTKQQIRRMESTMLHTLGWYISYPLPLHFLRRNSKAAQVDGTQHTLAKYLMELCLPDYNMCHYKPSEIGAAALCLTMKLIGPEPEWTDTLVYYSSYTEAHLTPIICKMAQCITRSHSSKQQSIPTKYRSSKYMKISELPQLKGKLIRTLSEKATTCS